SSRQLAELVKRQLEAKLALGDLGFLGQDQKTVPLFRDYAKNWLAGYAELECKPSTAYSYAQLLRLHVTPRFGDRRLTEITRDDVKLFLADLSQAVRVVKEIEVPRFSKSTNHQPMPKIGPSTACKICRPRKTIMDCAAWNRT